MNKPNYYEQFVTTVLDITLYHTKTLIMILYAHQTMKTEDFFWFTLLLNGFPPMYTLDPLYLPIFFLQRIATKKDYNIAKKKVNLHKTTFL